MVINSDSGNETQKVIILRLKNVVAVRMEHLSRFHSNHLFYLYNFDTDVFYTQVTVCNNGFVWELNHWLLLYATMIYSINIILIQMCFMLKIMVRNNGIVLELKHCELLYASSLQLYLSVYYSYSRLRQF